MDDCVRIPDENIRMMDKMPERNPTDGTFELTIRCNLHCKMCLFRHDDCENAEIMANELTAEQWIDMARQVAEAGTLSLLITGGEPMFRQDFCEIWEGIYKQGFIITLYTNATLVTNEVMETLRKYPPHKIGVTVYGASPETYEKVTGSAKAFEQMLEGIRKLNTLPSEITYRMTVIKDNYGDVDATEDLIKNIFDSNTLLTTTRMVHKPVRGGCADVDACRLPAEMNIQLVMRHSIKKIKEVVGDRFESGQVVLRDIQAAESDTPPRYSLFGCAAGMSSYTISWDNKLLGCQLLEGFSRTINSDFLSAWISFPNGVVLPPISQKCKVCEFVTHCKSCVATRFAESGTYSEGSDYICEDTKAECFLLKKGEIINEALCKT